MATSISMHPFLDPTGQRFGVPTFPWGWSALFDPDLRTKAQLREEGLSIAGLEVAGQLMWRSTRAGSRNGVRTAYLYQRSLARPVRPLTPTLDPGPGARPVQGAPGPAHLRRVRPGVGLLPAHRQRKAVPELVRVRGL